MIWIILCFAGTEKWYKLRAFSFSNHNSLELQSQYINLILQFESKRSIFFTMHLRELFSPFSLLVMMMAPSECADAVKLEDEMAEGTGLWTADSNDELESRSDTLCCNPGDGCTSGFMCGPQFPPASRCCPNGMKCTNSGSGCIWRKIWSSGIHLNVFIIILECPVSLETSKFWFLCM